MVKKVEWQYYFARKFSLQRFEVVLRVFISDFYWKHFKVRLKNIMMKPEEGGNHAIWLDGGEYDRAIRKIFVVVCRDLKTFHYYRQMIERTQVSWVNAARAVGRATRQDLSRGQLGKLYNKFIYWHQEHFNKPIWIIFPIEPVLSAAVEKTLRAILARTMRQDEYDRWMKIIFSQEEKNVITKMHEAVLQAALKIKVGKMSATARVRIAESLALQYGFIPCYDVIDPPWTADHFSKEIKLVLIKSTEEIRHELHEVSGQFRHARNEFRKFLNAFPMLDRERELFQIAHEFVFLKDDRDDHRRLGCYYGRPLFTELGRRLGLSTKEASYLSIEETKKYFTTGIAPSVAIIRERVQGYVLLRKHGNPMVIASGAKMKKMLARELGTRVATLENEVRGFVGSPGTVSGNVVIIHTKHDLRRVHDGAIMVSVTTNPDYVPAMRKCKAIVTDEGGITSHAAIVCRELGIPCVVGTKNGTKVFKEGDKVEVRAKHGVIRKLK